MSQKAECVDVRDAFDSISRDVSGKKGHKDFGVISDAGNASWRNHPVI